MALHHPHPPTHTHTCCLLCSVPFQSSGGSSSSRQDKARSLTPRILVAAHTNVAVDRVLLGLMDAGFSNMLRVGSLQRIAKRLLGVSLHSAGEVTHCLCTHGTCCRTNSEGRDKYCCVLDGLLQEESRGCKDVMDNCE